MLALVLALVLRGFGMLSATLFSFDIRHSFNRAISTALTEFLLPFTRLLLFLDWLFLLLMYFSITMFTMFGLMFNRGMCCRDLNNGITSDCDIHRFHS